ncbi:YCF48-related protein [Mucilaginibacter sp. PAMB04274]|uniref:WD40/YVTN/BNR-like repeat-containing protein n=1 Tax=Mucilaginibacter sp. PAMB04274 TaxID=3138568 RepID=UPI0031F664C8
MKSALIIFCLLITHCLQAQTITLIEQGKSTSIRGLSVVSDKVAWVSGSKGHVAVTTDGGHSWAWQQVKGFEQSDFRDVEAFSDKEAIIMSSGTPALILRTVNGGASWNITFQNNDKAYFLDGMGFFDAKHGLVMGDPINGKFLLLETKDSGRTWNALKTLPEALANEAAFAASGTSLRVLNSRNNVLLLTGGSTSRILLGVGLKSWSTIEVPLIHGQPSQGGFSIAVGGGGTVVVGGDYQQNKKADSVACYYSGNESRMKFQLAKQMPGGYQSCVTYLFDHTFLSTGTSGSNITNDGGATWRPIDTESYNVCEKAKSGNLILLAGDKGKIAIFKN